MLELGPGIGFFTLELARLVGSSGRVITVECPATDDCRFAATRSQGGSWPAASMPVWFRQYRSGPRCSTWVDQHFGGWTDRQMKPRGRQRLALGHLNDPARRSAEDVQGFVATVIWGRSPGWYSCLFCNPETP